MRLRPHWRKMTWVLYAWVAATILFIVLINGPANSDVREDCVGDTFECDTAISIASGFWTATGIIIGFLGFFALGLIWFMTRPKQQQQTVYMTQPGTPLPPPPPR